MWKIYFGGNLEIYIFDGFCNMGGEQSISWASINYTRVPLVFTMNITMYFPSSKFDINNDS